MFNVVFNTEINRTRQKHSGFKKKMGVSWDIASWHGSHLYVGPCPEPYTWILESQYLRTITDAIAELCRDGCRDLIPAPPCI